MSYTIDCREKITVINKDGDTKLLLKEVGQYIERLLNFTGAMQFDLNSLIIKADDQVVKLEEMSDMDIKSSPELVKPVVELAKLLDQYSEVDVYLVYYVMRLMGSKHGLTLFEELLSDEMQGKVTYKCLEYYDVDSDVNLYLFDEIDGQLFRGLIEAKEDISLVQDITHWGDQNFGLNITLPDESFISRMPELECEFADLKNKYCINVNKSDDKDVLKYEASQFHSVEADVLSEYIKSLQKLNDVVNSMNGELALTNNFSPCGLNDYGFTKLELSITDRQLRYGAARI